ncbi:MAG: KTSC domain-containing protein [Proteobacteria bacterium]|nr:KTSC domain-containing protein [Pseudomonadota bacterium]
MPSSVVQTFVYDSEHSRLTVTFVSGRVYEYYLVPPSVAAGFRGSRSKGTYFNKFIRDRYHCREIKAA